MGKQSQGTTRPDPNIWQDLPAWINSVYYPWLFDMRRYNVFFGGAASGKSFFVAERIIFRAMSMEGRNTLVIRKVDRENRFSTFALLVQIINLWGVTPYFAINRSTMTIVCTLNGNEIAFRGLDNPEKIKSITFETGVLTDIWCEEATELELQDFRQLRLRLRGGAHVWKQITLTFNPISILHWAKRFFFDKPLPENQCGILKTTYRDNKHLSADDRSEIENLKHEDETYYQVYALGNWGILGNRVFINFVVENFDYTEKDLENVCAGMDFGFAHASALERMGFKDDELYSFDECYGKGWTNAAFITAAVEQWGDALYSWDITADSANPGHIKEWTDAGYRVSAAAKGEGSVRFGIDYLSARRWHIHATRCPNLAREVQSFKRREDKDGNAIDAFVEVNDDCIAAARYATEFIWSQSHGHLADYSAASLGL